MTKNKGFTLIELIISIVIYGIIMTSVLASFWTLVKTRERADHFRNLEREVHFAMTRLSDTLRGNGINYIDSIADTGPFPNGPADVHPKVTTNHCKTDPIFFTTTCEKIEFKGENLAVLAGGIPGRDIHPRVNVSGLKELNVLMDGRPLFSRKVQLTDGAPNYLKVRPQNDPTTNLGDADMQIQPRVEIFLTVEDVEFPELKLNVKTTVSSRRYSASD
ncbi:MAG TPA: prepilin-type N-terminal cleavage/methylation domain-containing protein [Candidatus Gracilibacteria bacterium]